VRFARAKGAITYGMELMLALTPWQAPSEKAQKIQDKYLELRKKYGSDNGIIQDELRAWIKKNADELQGVTHYDNVDSHGVFHDGDVANTVFGGYKYEVIHPIAWIQQEFIR